MALMNTAVTSFNWFFKSFGTTQANPASASSSADNVGAPFEPGLDLIAVYASQYLAKFLSMTHSSYTEISSFDWVTLDPNPQHPQTVIGPNTAMLDGTIDVADEANNLVLDVDFVGSPGGIVGYPVVSSINSNSQADWHSSDFGAQSLDFGSGLILAVSHLTNETHNFQNGHTFTSIPTYWIDL
jgi:hypothetical protein